MADENNTDNTTTIVEATTPAETAPAKRRGGRPKKVASETIAETAEANVAQPTTGRSRGKGKTASVKASKKPVGVAKSRKAAAAKNAGKEDHPAAASVQGIDEIADLLQLEEENLRLRKALSEKLRAENADLRKRLGLS